MGEPMSVAERGGVWAERQETTSVATATTRVALRFSEITGEPLRECDA
jgi:hypothetical protein